jgi:probable HAF family extracellular repeat protein
MNGSEKQLTMILIRGGPLAMADPTFAMAGIALRQSLHVNESRRKTMIRTIPRIYAITLFAAVAAQAQPVAREDKPQPPRYKVIDLGTLGGTYSYAYGLNNAGVVAGGAATPSQIGGLFQTAFLWDDGQMINLGTLGGAACPDCNSEAGGPNASGVSAVISETANLDKNKEDFCGFGTHRQCLAAIWKDGALKALPTLPGGNNAEALWINARGQVIGVSENGVPDSSCSTATPSQVHRFQAVMWGRNGEIRQLPPLKGDTVGFGFGINDKGQAVGSSGLCSNTALPPFTNGPLAAHAVLWDRDGTPHDLGSLVNGATINIAGAINDRGEVAGGAQSSSGAPHAFLWTKTTGMQDLGTVSGDFASAAPCCHTLNNRREVVGFSCPGPMGICRAFLWQGNEPMDLNDLSPASPLYLQQALSINDAGQIVGFGVTSTGETHAFLATPAADDDTEESLSAVPQGYGPPTIPAPDMRQLLRLWIGIRER